MLDRRNHHIFARAGLPLPVPAANNSPSVDAKTPDPTPSTPATPSSPSPSAPSAVSATSASSSPVSSASSAATSSATSSASSLSSAHASTPSTPLGASPTSPLNNLPVATQPATGVSYTPTPTMSQSASATPSSGSSGGTSTSTIVAGVAGTLAGLAVLGFLLMWCMRRQRDRDTDDFDSQAFKRQSAILVDDPADPYNPRPPTMIERHNASPALAAQSSLGNQNFYGNYGGYGQQPSYQPEMGPSVGGYGTYEGSQQQIIRQPSNVGYAEYQSQQQLARQPSNAQYLTRQPSAAAGYAPAAPPPNTFGSDAHYIDLNRSSVSPYQAAQYADISRQLGAVDPNQHVPHGTNDLPDGPLPSPFDDHVVADAAPPHRRPSVHFEEGNPYGGI